MQDFKSPKANRLLIKTAQRLLPLILRRSFKGLKLHIDPESVERLKAIEGHRTVLIPNHADYADAYMMFALSKRLRQQFYYMTAREMFDAGHFSSLKSFFMQRLGAYSVVRGTVDRESFRVTRTLLTTQTQPLVVFAEGGLSRQNDTVMPFESGVVQLCFWALDDMNKAGELQPLYAVPIGIKYTYNRDMWDEIEAALTRLERRVLPHGQQTSQDLYERLRIIGVNVLSIMEKTYKLGVNDTDLLDDRIQRLREHILSQIEDVMQIRLQSEDELPRKRVRTLKNRIDAEVYKDTREMTVYEREEHERRLETFRQFYLDINRLFNFIAIYAGYVEEKPSQERFLEVIARLEIEVFGASKPKGPRTAFMCVGTPKNLSDVYQTYRSEKRETTQVVTLELEKDVQEIVSSL